MKKIYLMLFAVMMLATGSFAQSIINYTYTTNTNGSLEDLSIGSTTILPGNNDDASSTVAPVGFDFFFMGVRYSHFSANSNGQMTFHTSLGATPIGSNVSSLGATSVTLAPFAGDNEVNNGIRYKVLGIAPNRKLVIEWNQFYVNFVNITNAGNMQVWLEEGTGNITYMYGEIYNTSATAGLTRAIFLASSNTATTAGTITIPAAPASPCTFAATATLVLNPIAVGSGTTTGSPLIQNIGSATNGSRTFFNFASVTPSAAPTGLNFTGVTLTGTTLNWTDNATNEIGYAVYRSIDGGVTYNFYAQTAANIATYAATGLLASTNYFWRVVAFTEGAVSASVDGNQATSSCSKPAATYSVGPTGTYTSLTAALLDLNATGLTGPTILELQPAYVSTVETFPITINAIPCLGAANPLTIRPATGATNLSITSANTTATLDINGGNYVTIDGRPGGVGTTKQLTIANTSIATGGTAIRFINEANNNVVTYSTLRSSFASTTSGVVIFSTTTGVNGNDNNTISSCDIDGAGLATNGIYSLGTTTTTATNNSGILITNNNVFNYFAAALDHYGLSVLGGNTDWTITGNSFYQTVSRAITTNSTTSGIRISSTLSNNNIITGNYIGGTAPLCGGTAQTYTGTATVGIIFRGLQLTVGTITATSVQGNTIQNLNLTSGSTSTSQSGISLLTGRLNVGNVIGNTIGSQSLTNSIVFVNSSTSTAQIFSGILAGTGTGELTNISNNTIGGITVSSSSTGSTSVRGIGFQGTTGTFTINNNTIGSTTTANSITNATNSSLLGIFGGANITTATQNITNNTVANVRSTTTGTTAQIIGILAQGSTGGIYNTTGNTVRDITSSAPNIGTSGGSSVIGIAHTAATTAGQTVSQNTVFNLSNTAVAATAITLSGIYYTGPTTGTNIVSRNFVHSLSITAATGLLTTLDGMRFNNGLTTIHNNIVAVGNTTSSNATNINGIIEVVGTNNYYFNTVHVSGSTNNTVIGAAFNNQTTVNTRIFRNNIFVNTRTNAGTGKCAAVSVGGTAANPAGLTINNNDYWVAGVGTVLGRFNSLDVTTLAAWQTAVGQDAQSANVDPTFIAPAAATPNLHITSGPTLLESGGVPISGITIDFDGDIRNVSTPDIGADEFTGTPLDLFAPSIVYTPLNFTCTFANRTLTATITDPSGVPTSGAGLPVLYWKVNAGAYTPVTGVSIGSNQYTFTFGAGVVLADVVSYYIVAQDNVGTPNVGVFPSAGAAGFTANPPAASTPPTTPSSYAISNVLSGTYTVGVTGTYPTITAAVNAYNTSCLGGPVVFSLIDATYTTTSDTIRINTDASAINTLTIQPTVTSIITGNTTAATLVLLGADYVTIDGSIISTANTICPLKTSNRDLTIANSNVGTASAVIWLTHNGADGANNNTIKNCNIVGNASTTTILGIGSGGGAIGSLSTLANNNNNSYINNNISKLQIGMYFGGISSALKDQGTTINQNLINTVAPNNVSRGGIAAFAQNNLNVNGNNISEMSITASVDAFGIALGSLAISTTSVASTVECTNATVTYNQIGSIRHTSTYSALGIYLAPGAVGTSLISNNMIRGVSANGTSSDFSVGIFVTPADGSVTNIYYNTVSMSGTQTGGSEKSYALAIAGGTTPTIDIRNNILINKQNNGTGINYAYGLGYTAFTNITSDYNDIYTTTGALYATGATGSISAPTAQLTFANLQAATAKDANSKNVDAAFVSATDLHLNTAANATLNAGATPVSVTNDIDCEARDSSTPDIGADEFIYVAPTCAIPTAVATSAITTTGATVSWTGPLGTYILEYGLAGFTPGTAGTAGVGGTIINPATSPQAITGLANGTTYNVYVRQDCTLGLLGYSSNTPLLSFTTIVPPPANDDCATATVIPCDGSVSGNNTAAANDVLAPITCGSTTSTLGTNKGVWFTVTPTNSGPLTVSTCTGTAWDTYLRAYTGTCGTFTACAGFDDDGCTESTFGLSSLTFTATAGTTYYILMGGYDAPDFGAYTISATCPPACAVPTTIAINSLASTSVNVTWTGSPASIVEYGLTGFTPGTGATAGVGGTVINPATSPQAITGLTASTAYQVYVRQNCTGASAGYSANSTVVAFTTLAPPVIPICPVLTTPANASTICASAGTILTWTAAAGATSYDVYLDAGAGPATTLISASQVGLTYNAGLLGSGAYSWKVNAKNSAGVSVGCTDFTFTIISKPTVTTNPTGTISICSPATQLLAGTTSAATPAYQWLNNNVPIAAATTMSYTVIGIGSGSYRLKVTDGVTGCTDTSVAVIVTINDGVIVAPTATPAIICNGNSSVLNANASPLSGTPTYCTPSLSGLSASGDYMDNFSFANITNNGSGDAATDYTYYSALTANLVADGVTPYSISCGTGGTSSTFGQQYRIWIDYNKNGIFESSESVFNTTSSTWVGGTGANAAPATGSITIPNTAFNGITRMRVKARFNSTPAASEECTGGIYGEYEDYNVNITGGTEQYTYVWSPATFLSSTTVANPIATGVTNTTTYTVTATGAGGCNQSANVTVTVLPPGVSTWTGAINTDWNNVGNWNCGGIPTITSEVVIPAGRPNYPVITLNVEIKKLTVDPATSVTVATGFNLKLNGN
jgi:trimeric autotransporter adhesin